MKTAYLYFVYAAFNWDCWKCGYFHVLHLYHDDVHDGMRVLKCSRCGTERKAKIGFDYVYPDTPERRKKLKKKEAKWYKENIAKHMLKTKKKRKSK